MAETFQPPSWAAPPACRAWLEVRRSDDAAQMEAPHDCVRVDGAPWTTFGRAADVADVCVDDSAASRLHAALVHHPSGKLYIIELNATRGTLVDNLRLERHRPLQLKDGFRIRFGDASRLMYTVRIQAGAPDAVGGSGSAPARASKRPREGAPADDGRVVRASHILVKHAGSRRPSSFREAVVTRSKAEALAMLDAFRARLAAGESTFAELAEAESHCSSAKRGGDLGPFGRGKMQRPFEEAAFALEVGAMSGPVETDSGVHLILRTE